MFLQKIFIVFFSLSHYARLNKAQTTQLEPIPTQSFEFSGFMNKQKEVRARKMYFFLFLFLFWSKNSHELCFQTSEYGKNSVFHWALKRKIEDEMNPMNRKIFALSENELEIVVSKSFANF